MLEIPKDVCEATCSALRDAHILADEADKHLIADKINEALTMLEDAIQEFRGDRALMALNRQPEDLIR
jgi:hypothetical protein